MDHIEPAPAVLDEPLLQRPRIVRWFASRPRIADVLVILVCTAPTAAALIVASPPHMWLGVLCAAGVAATLWWRRSHPFVVLLVAVALATLNPVAANSVTPAFFESAFTLFALAARARLRVAILGYALCVLVIFGVAWLGILLGTRDAWPMTPLQPAALAAIAFGVAARASGARREAFAELVALREDRAATAERARITAEMHDVVAHSVTVMVSLAGGAAMGWDRHPARARAALDQLGIVGARTLEDMQRILRVLRTHDSDLDRNLEASGHNLPTLEDLAETFRATGIAVSLRVDPAFERGVADGASLERVGSDPGSRGDFDPALRTTVYRIVQESLTNVVRHARDATFAEVAVDVGVAERGGAGSPLAAAGAGWIVVTVTDNGAGARQGPSPGSGTGLRAMRERALAFGGELDAGPIPASQGSPATGWRTRVEIPVAALAVRRTG